MSLSVLESLLLGVFGIAVVFVILFGLSMLLRIQSALVTRFTHKRPAAAAVSKASAAPPPPAVSAAPPAVKAPAGQAASSPATEPPAGKTFSISSPVAGTVIDILTMQGAHVRHDQALLILDTMKMEHEIVAPRDGTVVQILKSKGAFVEAGAPLITLQ